MLLVPGSSVFLDRTVARGVAGLGRSMVGAEAREPQRGAGSGLVWVLGSQEEAASKVSTW